MLIPSLNFLVYTKEMRLSGDKGGRDGEDNIFGDIRGWKMEG